MGSGIFSIAYKEPVKKTRMYYRCWFGSQAHSLLNDLLFTSHRLSYMSWDEIHCVKTGVRKDYLRSELKSLDIETNYHLRRGQKNLRFLLLISVLGEKKIRKPKLLLENYHPAPSPSRKVLATQENTIWIFPDLELWLHCHCLKKTHDGFHSLIPS